MSTLRSFPCLFLCLILIGLSTSLRAAESDTLVLLLNQKLAFHPALEDSAIHLWASHAQRFISDPKNRRLLSTAEGRRLLQKEAKVATYLSVKTAFRQCGASTLGAEAATDLSAMPDSRWECSPKPEAFPTIEQLSKSIQSIARNVHASTVKAKLANRIIRSFAATDAEMHLSIDVSPGYPSAPRICSMLNERYQGACTPEIHAILTEEEASMVHAHSKKALNAEAAATEINRVIGQFNHASSDQERFVLLSQGPAHLLYTSVFQFALGDPRLSKTLKTPASAEMVRRALQEIDTRAAHEIARFAQLPQDQVKDAVAEYPLAVAQVLAGHPEFAPNLCTYYSQIAQEPKNRERADDQNKRVMSVGFATLGGALILSGAGAWAGAPLAATVGTSVYSGAYSGKEWVDSSQRESDLEDALLSSSGSASNYRQMKRALNEWNKASMELGLLGLEIPLSAVPGEAALKIGGTQALTQIARTIAHSAPLLKAFRGAQQAGVDLSAVIGKLSSQTPEAGMKALRSMKGWGADQFKGFVNGGKELIQHPHQVVELYKLFMPSYQRPVAGQVINRTTGEWLSHPPENLIETTLGKAWKPASNVGRVDWIGFLRATAASIGLTHLEEYWVSDDEKRNTNKLNRLKTGSPGADYVSDFMKSNLIQPLNAVHIVLSNNHFLKSWSLAQDDRSVLPRITVLARANLLTQNQAEALNKIAREAYQEADHAFSLDPKNFPAQLENSFKKTLALKSSGSLSRIDRRWFNLLFSPLIPLGKYTDLQLQIALSQGLAEDKNQEEKRLADLFRKARKSRLLADQQNLANYAESTAKSRDQQILNLTLPANLEALKNRALSNIQESALEEDFKEPHFLYPAAESALNAPGDVIDKIRAGASFMPAGHLNALAMPDIPALNEDETRIDSGHTVIKSDLDRWKLLVRDQRFCDIAAYWTSFRLSDRKALLDTEARIQSISDESFGKGPQPSCMSSR